MKKILFTFSLLFSFSSFAADTDLFHKLISVQRDSNGTITQLEIRKQQTGNALAVRDNWVRSMLELSSKAKETEAALADMDMQGWTEEEKNLLADAKKAMKKAPKMAQALQDEKVTEVLKKFELDLLKIFSFQVVARPRDAGYFHSNTMIQFALDAALKLAGQVLGSLPVLDVVGFIIERTLMILEERRTFYQNVVLHYLDAYPASELGLTDEDVALIKSSIYESRLAWYDFDGANDAKEQWANFGSDVFTAKQIRGLERIEKYGKKYDKVLEKFNMAYVPAMKKQSLFILDVQNKKSKLSQDLSVAYNFDKPKKIQTVRISIQVVQIASRFSPIPGLALRALDWLLDSYYVPQKNTEGMLYAYLMIHGRTAEAKVVVDQSTNPLLMKELK